MTDLGSLVQEVRARGADVAAAEERRHEAAGRLLGEARKQDGVVARCGDEYLFVPGEWGDPQCVATTRKGDRCKNSTLGGGQRFHWDDAGVAVYDPESWAKVKRQVCDVHDDGGSDYAQPEWRLLNVPADA